MAFLAALAGGLCAAPLQGLANPSILIDAATGRVLESDSPTQRWYPASLSKLMTTYVAFRAVQSGEVTLASPVRISKKAAALPPSKMGYKPGSELTLDNALKIIMVKSANDVALSIGESIAGSEAAFAERMNAESRRLGMTDSHWVNPHGLHDPGQYSSPRDLAILATALRREFPQYAAYFSIEGLEVGGKEVPSHNHLIGRFDGADGMKTGYTCPAGFNLVASATRDGRTLMAVVVGSESVSARDEKAAAMLARGFGVAAGSGLALADLKATVMAAPVDMTQQLCSKEARAARAKEAKELAKAIKAGLAQPVIPIYEVELPRPRVLVAVDLGGATGPVPKAMAEAAVYADVPIPQWRPDMPSPVARQAEQGDAAAPAK
jgi:D-alanyl-D-alanine carboxypeptidase